MEALIHHVLPGNDGDTSWFYRQNSFEQQGTFRQVAFKRRRWPTMENGAKRVVIPSENKRNFADVPSDVLEKLQIIFFLDPVNAAFRVMGVD